MAVQVYEASRNGRRCVAQDAKKPLRISANLYARNNSLQRKHNNTVLEFCEPAFLAEARDTMQVLDVGCGTGDFTRDFLLPRCLPCARLIGIDCSVDMIEHARRHSVHEKIEYEVLDIGEDVNEFIARRGHFDRVYSFYSLQWLRDQGAALKNIAALMAPAAQCVLVFPASHQPATVWSLLAQMDRWAKYSETLLQFIAKSHHMEKAEQILYMSSLLREAGLCPNIFVLSRLVTFDGWSEHEIVGAEMSLLPINHLVSDDERALLLDDVTTLVRKVHGPETDQSIFRTYIIMATKRKG
ncbi:juvenile hormone acid O-methyltransferase [Rhipicephalus sanguineus]|uniref:Juvenile hormone acid methyltransferase n=1 Tax=Rhipicephalus sanguineus TaxID=34632 RepID=A0A9D4Q198_RHISA|nr:juvenile hormone acid O-methyltransferase [Rhipicephalus sanguineus]KAH7961286.1 hypothetical protein HPB52_006679 [Rhipicephalus sanguineus]